MLPSLLNFIEILNLNQLNYALWYDVLNMGFRVTPTAGTDYPCAAPPRLPGHERFYTKVEGELTYKNWLESVRDGKTFVTTGPLIEFSVDGQDIGSEVTLTNNRDVLIEGSVVFDPQKDRLFGLELVENGQVIKFFPPNKDSNKLRFFY